MFLFVWSARRPSRDVIAVLESVVGLGEFVVELRNASFVFVADEFT